MILLLASLAFAQDPPEVVAPWPAGWTCGVPPSRNALVYERCNLTTAGATLSARIYEGEAATLDEICAGVLQNVVALMADGAVVSDGRGTWQGRPACDQRVSGVLASQGVQATARQVLVAEGGRWYLVFGLYEGEPAADVVAAWDRWFAETRFAALEPPPQAPASEETVASRKARRRAGRR